MAGISKHIKSEQALKEVELLDNVWRLKMKTVTGSVIFWTNEEILKVVTPNNHNNYGPFFSDIAMKHHTNLPIFIRDAEACKFCLISIAGIDTAVSADERYLTIL